MNYIKIKNLTYKYDNVNIFENLNLEFNSSKCYLITGLNGCGKSTLLKLIGGKMLAQHDSVSVLNKDPFRDTSLNKHIAYLNNDWGTRTVAYCGYNIPLQSHIKVKEMMMKIKEEYPERNEELLNVLKINPEWSLNAISDGQRKRVQIYLALIKPFDICLLDEVTINLDIIIKNELMNYLKKESIENKACIIYVTHIFDGLDKWCDNLLYLRKNGSIGFFDEKPKDNIYDFLLKKIYQEDKYEIEKVNDMSIFKNSGYNSGVLINFNYIMP